MLRVAWKSLMGRKLRLMMSLVAITIGVGFVVGSYVFGDTLNQSFTTIFNSGVPDLSVKYGKTDDRVRRDRPVPASLVRRLETLPEAARVDGRVRSGGVVLLDKKNKIVGSMGPPTFAFNDSSAPAARGVKGIEVLTGEHPHGVGQVVMDRDTALRAGYYLGERVSLVLPGRQSISRPVLVGLAGYRDGSSLNGATILIWDTTSAQKLFHEGKDVYDTVWMTPAAGVSQQELKTAVDKILPRGYSSETGDQAAKRVATVLVKVMSFITTFLLVIAGIALVVGSFLIVNTFSILVAQRSKELALLRALGASKRQVTTSVLVEAFVVGLLGSTLGTGFGLLVAWLIRLGAKSGTGLDISGTDFVFAPRTFVVAYAVGMIVTMSAAWFPARRSAKIAPVAALRDDVALPASSLRLRVLIGALLALIGAAGIYAGLNLDVPKPAYWVGGGVLAALLAAAAASPALAKPFLLAASAVYRGGFGEVGRLAGQNSLRNPRRTAATASALMIGLSLVATMAIIGSSAKASVDETVADTFRADLVISDLAGGGFAPGLQRRVAKVPGVSHVVPGRFGPAQFKTDRVWLAGFDPKRMGEAVKLDIAKGRPSFADNRCVLDKEFASTHKLGIGDTIRMRTPAGPRRFVVDATYTVNATLWSTCLVNLSTYTKAGYDDLDSILYLTLTTGADRTTVKSDLSKRLEKLPTASVLDQAGFAAQQRKPIDQMVAMINMLLGLALVIAVLGIINTLGLSVIERTREIGLLRAIGVNRPQLRRMIGLESVVIAVLGALLGVGMGLVFGTAIVASLRDQGLTVTAIPSLTLAGFVAGAAVIGVLAALLPARRAAQLDVLKAIATE